MNDDNKAQADTLTKKAKGYFFAKTEWSRSVGWGHVPPERDVTPESEDATLDLNEL